MNFWRWILLTLTIALPLAAQTTNQPPASTGTGIQPLTPLRPLTPLKPLNTPSASAGAGAGATAAKGTAPLKITSFMTSQIPEPFVDERGQRIVKKYFRVQFKISDPAVNSLDAAMIYLFNQKKELVGSLSDFSPTAKLSGTDVRENVINYPNMLTSLTGLEKNKNYNLIFMYTANEIQFKYAVAVVGTKEKLVADTIPGSARADDFAFDGKDKLVQ
jgi:hypothetical protein